MNIDFKDEYATLRQEMLERFGRIHDTAKYGIGAFIAFLSYYYTRADFDNFIALTIFQLLVALVGMCSLRLYHSIYRIGTYIEVIIEDNSEAKWHRMSRSLNEHKKKYNIDTFARNAPFPLGTRWGEDSTQIAILLVTLMLIGLFAVFSQAPTLSTLFRSLFPRPWAPFFPWCTSQNIIFIVVIVLLICNVLLVYKLSLGIRRFKDKEYRTWKKYRSSFKNDFSSKYADCEDMER